LTPAQVGQRAPTGVSTMQRGQMGVSQRPQRSTVSVPGWRAQRNIGVSSSITAGRVTGQ